MVVRMVVSGVLVVHPELEASISFLNSFRRNLLGMGIMLSSAVFSEAKVNAIFTEYFRP